MQDNAENKGGTGIWRLFLGCQKFIDIIKILFTDITIVLLLCAKSFRSRERKKNWMRETNALSTALENVP